MAILTLNPPVGAYEGTQTVTVSGPAGYKVVVTQDGTPPKYTRKLVETRKFNPVRPNLVYTHWGDSVLIQNGGFLTGSYAQEAKTFEQLGLNDKIQYNLAAIQAKGIGESKKLLFMDLNRYSGGPGQIFDLYQNVMNMQCDYINVSDFGPFQTALVDPTLGYLMNYDIIIVRVAEVYSEDLSDGNPSISAQGALNIAEAFSNGVGVTLLFNNTKNINQNKQLLVNAFQLGNVDDAFNGQDSTNVNLLEGLYGPTPVFRGLTTSERSTQLTTVGATWNYVAWIHEPPTNPANILDLPLNLSVGEATSDLRFIIIAPDGTTTYERHNFAVDTPYVYMTDGAEGPAIEVLPETNLSHRPIYIGYNSKSTSTTTSGSIQVGGETVATFTNEAHSSNVPLDFIDSSYSDSGINSINVNGDQNPDIVVNMTEPIEMSLVYSFNRYYPNEPSDYKPSRFLANINRNEYRSNVGPASALSLAQDELLQERELVLHNAIDQVYKEWVRWKYTPNATNPSNIEVYYTYKLWVTDSQANATRPYIYLNQLGELTSVQNTVSQTSTTMHLGNSANAKQTVRVTAYSPTVSSHLGGRDIGLIIGTRVDGTSRWFLVCSVSLYTSMSNFTPRVSISLIQINDRPFGYASEPNSGFAIDANQTQTFNTVIDMASYESNVALDWPNYPFNDGITLHVDFDGTIANVAVSDFGKPIDLLNPYMSGSLDVTTISGYPAGGIPIANGLYCSAVNGVRWLDYKIG